MNRILILLLFASMTIVSCKTRLTDFTLISTKNIDLARGAEFERGKGGYSRVEGEDVAHIIIFIPFEPNLKEAIDRAIESVPGCIALLDGVVYSKSFYIPWIYGQSKYVVEGTPLIDPNLVSDESKILKDGYHILHFDRKTDRAEIKTVSREEYAAIRTDLQK